MRAALAIAQKEIRERWTWLGLSLVLGWLPLGGRFVGIPDLEMQGTIALLFFMLLAVVSTLALGSSIMAGDLVQNRLGFFLARPVSWWSIWAGKLMATLLLAGASIVVFIPALLRAWGAGKTVQNSLDAVGAVVFLSWFVIGIALAQAAAIGLKSRSSWLLVDLAAAFAVAWVGTRVLFLMGLSGAVGDGFTGLAIVVAGGALATGAATAAPFAFGGVSVRRAHVAFSATLWSVLLVLLMVGGVASYWAAHPRASDFRTVWSGTSDAQGRWILGIGHARGLAETRPALFYASADGATPTLVGTTFTETWTSVFSEDGSAAAWIEGMTDLRAPVFGLAEHVYFAQAANGAAPRTGRLDLPLPLEGYGNALALSRNGGRLAVSLPNAVHVYELPSGRALTRIPAPAPLYDRRVVFADDETILIYGTRQRGGRIDILRAPLASGRLDVTGEMDAGQALISAPPARVVNLNPSTHRATLHDATTGERLATLADDAASSTPEVAFTADGRIALLAVRGGQARLRLVTASGAEEREIELGPATATRLDVDSHGRLLAGLFTPAGQSTTVIDSTDLHVVKHLPGFLPLRSSWDLRFRSRPHSNGAGGDLFLDTDRRIVKVDAESGASTVVIGPRG